MSEKQPSMKVTATFYYPGSFFSEDVSRTIQEPTLDAALAVQPDDHWFAVEVSETPVKVFRSDDGEERVLSDGKRRKVGKWYVGEEFTAKQVEALDGDHDILLSNMRGNGWRTVVRTRRGNFQPIEKDDHVLATVRGKGSTECICRQPLYEAYSDCPIHGHDAMLGKGSS